MQHENWHSLRKTIVIVLGIFIGSPLFAQQPPKKNAITDIDTSINYDEFFSALDNFFDSLYSPHSFAVISTSITDNYYNFKNPNNKIQTLEKLTFTPSLAYYHKNGLGIGATASVINENQQWNPYQYAVSGSYDYIKKRIWVTGITYTRFFTRDSLSFYTSPLQNQVTGYFTYRKWWVKPLVTLNYGWGNRTTVSETKEFIKRLKLKKGRPLRDLTGTTTTTTHESVNDFTLVTSVKHDFYWLNVVSKKDFVRLTPQLTLTSGTQKFGFNETSNMALSSNATGINILTDSKSMYLDNSANFRPLALTAFVKTEFSIGKFFVQPQVMVDYYIPALSDNVSTTYAVNTGFIF